MLKFVRILDMYYSLLYFHLLAYIAKVCGFHVKLVVEYMVYKSSIFHDNIYIIVFFQELHDEPTFEESVMTNKHLGKCGLYVDFLTYA